MSQSQSQIQQSRESAQFQLRLPDDLRSKIQAGASASGRSINSEIVQALAEKYTPATLAARAAADLINYINLDGTKPADEVIKEATAPMMKANAR